MFALMLKADSLNLSAVGGLQHTVHIPPYKMPSGRSAMLLVEQSIPKGAVISPGKMYCSAITSTFWTERHYMLVCVAL